MSMQAAQDKLTAPGAPFEMEEVPIRGVPTRTWKHALPTLAALTDQSRRHGDRPFFVYEQERISYAAHFRAVATLAHWLVDQGVRKGDRVGLAMRNLPEWPVIFLAATTIGAIAVPLNAWWTGAELGYGLADSGAAILFCDAERHHRIAPHRSALDSLRHIVVTRMQGAVPDDAIPLEHLIGTTDGYDGLRADSLPPVDLAADDEATIFYTSGTTGTPKGALGTHRNILTYIMSSGYAGARGALRRGAAVPPSLPKVRLTVVPLFHVTGCVASLIGGMTAGSTHVFMRKWDTVGAMRLIERERVNITGGVPTIAWQLLDHPDRKSHDLSSLEAIVYGGAPAPAELARRIHEELGAMPGNGWGMTETMSTVTINSAEDYLARPDSCGVPVAVADIRIVATDGVTTLPPGAIGELWVKGPMVVKGYWNRPTETAASFVDGWVRTGDLGRVDGDGFCTIVDRAKDVVIRGGENIYSAEVENILVGHPAVAEAALIAVPHRTLGEEPAAVVHLASGAGATESDLQAWVRDRLAAFKVPVRILFSADALPRNAGGKVIKQDLRPLFTPRET